MSTSAITARAIQRYAMCALCSLCTAALSAQPLADKHYFEFPAQPLADALQQFARELDQAVLFNPDLVAGREALSLRGHFSAKRAISQLLRGSGLSARYSNQGWLVQAPRAPAEPTAPTTPNAAGIEEVVATGHYLTSIERAEQQEREAAQSVDILLAEEIRHSPGSNIAEALSRNAGITVVRDRGQALFVSIRGLPTAFNAFTLNGNTLATNENVRTSGQYGRQFHYDTLPAELVAAVEIRKTPQAMDDEGAIGGSVNIQTYQPLELAENRLGLNFQLSQSSLASERDPHFSLMGNWVNVDNNLGVYLAASRSHLNLRQDRVMNFGWQQSTNSNALGDSGQAPISPGNIRPTLERENRQRSGLSLGIQQRIPSGPQWNLNYLQLKQEIDYREFSYSAQYSVDALVPGSAEIQGPFIPTGSTDSGSVQIGSESAGLVDDTHALDFSVEGDWHSNWHYRLLAAASQADSYNDTPIKRTRLRREGDVQFDFHFPLTDRGALPSVTYRNLSLSDSEAFPGRRLEWRKNTTQDRNLSGAFNLSRRIDFALLDSLYLDSLHLGAKYQRRTRDYQRTDAVIVTGIENRIFPDSYFDLVAEADFLATANSSLPTVWLQPQEDIFWQDVGKEVISKNLLNSQNRVNSYQVDESVTAAMAQLNLSGITPQGIPWRGNAGLRYAETRHHARGHQLEAMSDSVTPRYFTKAYDQWLPAANLTLDLSEALQWRTGIARTLKRPDLQDLAPRLTLHSGDEHSAQGGNPDLHAVTAWQLDSSMHWTLGSSESGDPVGILGAGLFYKSIDDFIHTDSTQIRIDGEPYLLTSKTNGGRAYVNGMELEYRQNLGGLPSPFDHLGLQMNLTFTNSRAAYRGDNNTTHWDPLEDVARHTANLGLYYDDRYLTARLQYSWRDRVLRDVGESRLDARNSMPFGTLDAHLTLALSDHLSLTAEGINLTDAAEWEYVAGGGFAGYSHYGRRLALGLNLKFH
ncbi:TonB-dependent receptor [Microbulbifer celer]|uniref:TonB-dependent receptor n=1 Tax=Microbulbifer celer TaxID=435905 RepID=A0ABW3U9S6_9GAMM|nr:TonB-dependent receptor [Microbulbifer celer]UFN56329.1 TonB-dependent receptor [Microbulbifer celer]